MPRDPADEQTVLTWLREQLATRPAAGFVVGVAEIDAEESSVGVTIGDVGCSPAQLVMLATATLETAAALTAAMPPTEAALGLARSIALGLRCLDLSGPSGTA